MNNYLFGLGTGLFLFWAGGLFLKFAIKALKERKEKEAVKTEETMEKLITRIMDKK
jgi:hypothetical protein